MMDDGWWMVDDDQLRHAPTTDDLGTYFKGKPVSQ